jgi:hypothetical protein
VAGGRQNATPARSPAGDTGMAQTPSSPPHPKVRLCTSTLPGGWQVLVGRTDADNDALSAQVGRPHDGWCHGRGMPGRHVILQGPPGADPDRQTLQRAAAIAASHSTARDAGVVAVSGTRVRDVSTPQGAQAGTVQIRHEEVCKVRPTRGDLIEEPGHTSASPRWRAAPPWRPAVTGAYADVGARVPAWAGVAAARPAGDPRPPTARQGS